MKMCVQKNKIIATKMKVKKSNEDKNKRITRTDLLKVLVAFLTERVKQKKKKRGWDITE